ncbi:zinc finger protein [Capsaspora owczarzaki ATCC 30864]|uniref:Zinc finger protein n=1 Tax=Capsaspora owczarzaki (strain ATCC 30864) TaxID=595528 RepID=A0A0D2UQ78_CAPO3|nr:zinc finger protein [Capsaspora owczarzaki ATCC 30864]
MLLDLLSNVDGYYFDVEEMLDQQLGGGTMTFEGMDKSGAEICKLFLRGQCKKGNSCAFRHTRTDKKVVCKHWLRGLCKKGEHCEFLHEYDMSKMPECYFFQKYGQCTNTECQYRHIDPETKKKDCPWYARGFCRHGAQCKLRHRKRVICTNYLTGFCPDGPTCQFAQ